MKDYIWCRAVSESHEEAWLLQLHPTQYPRGVSGSGTRENSSAHSCNSHMHSSKIKQIFKSIISWFDPVNNCTENVQVYVIPVILLVCVSAKISRYLISLKINQLMTWLNSKMSRRQPILTSITTTPASFLKSIPIQILDDQMDDVYYMG